MKAIGMTDKGRVRKRNEDDYCVCKNAHGDWLAIVCDGIGGSAAGEVASHMAAATVYEAFMKAPEFTKDYEVDDWLRSVLNQANDKIYAQSLHSRKDRGMGTTAAGVLVTKRASYVFNAGDSRVYALYGDGLTQMTEDHSVIAQLVRENRITEEEAKTHSQRNTLTNALGVWRVFRIDINKIEPNWHALLVCSDGLHGYVPQPVLENVLSDYFLDTRQKAQRLVDLANEAGGLDNVSAIILEREDFE